MEKEVRFCGIYKNQNTLPECNKTISGFRALDITTNTNIQPTLFVPRQICWFDFVTVSTWVNKTFELADRELF